jgi:hypothetical protein
MIGTQTKFQRKFFDKPDLAFKIVTPGIDWGNANRGSLEIIYEKELPYMILRTKGFSQAGHYMPAMFFLVKKTSDDTIIFLEEDAPGSKWQSTVNKMKEQLSFLKAIDKLKFDFNIIWTAPKVEGFHIFRKSVFGKIKGIHGMAFEILLPTKKKIKEFALRSDVFDMHLVHHYDESVGLDLVKAAAEGMLNKWIRRFIKK